MAIRIPWDEEETALLIDTYLQVEAKQLTLKEAVPLLSNQLRQRAKWLGIEIDGIFRNENGISMRLSEIQYLMTDGDFGLKNTSNLFKDMVHLYKTNMRLFKEILKKAKQEINLSEHSKKSFMEWLSNQVTAEKLSEMEKVYSFVEDYAISKKLLQIPFFEVSEAKVIASLRIAIKKDWGLRVWQRKKITDMFEACNYYERYLVNRQKETEGRSKSVSFVKPVDVVNKKLDTPNNPNDNLEKHQGNHSNTENTVKEESQPYNANDNGLNFVDFTSSNNTYLHTKPIYLEYFGKRHEADSWSEMYVCVLACLLDDYPDKIFGLSKNSLQNGGEMWLGDIRHRSQMSQPRKFAKGMFAEVNLSTFEIVQRIRHLLDYCLVDVENLVVAYRNIQKETNETTIQQLIYKQKKAVTAPSLAENKVVEGDPLHLLLRDAGLEFIDNRQNGGNLWIVGDNRLIPVIEQLQKMGLSFRFKKEGGRKSGGRPAWWTRDTLPAGKELTALTVPKNCLTTPPSSTAELSKERYNDLLKQALNKVTENRPESKFSIILKENQFQRGIFINSVIDIKRFRQQWQKRYGEELTCNDLEVEAKLRQSGVVHDGKVYHLDNLISPSNRKMLLKFVHRWMVEEDKAPIYYEALYKAFSEQLQIHGETINMTIDMLPTCLEAINPGYYRLEKKFLSLGNKKHDNHVPDIINLLRDRGEPMKIDEICNEMSHLTEEVILSTLKKEVCLINSGKDGYFHIDILDFNKAKIDEIVRVIQSEINENHRISGIELATLLQERLPHIMEPCSQISKIGLRNALKILLEDKFSFKGDLVSPLGKKLSVSDVFADFCQKNECFTLQDLRSLGDHVGQIFSSYLDTVYDNALRISENDFVAKNMAKFDVESTDTAIDLFCAGDYIPLEDITSFSAFPNAGYNWNVFLLQHYVYAYSARYRLLHNGFSAGTAKGAIVKKDSHYSELRDVLIHDLANSQVTLRPDDALDFFLQRGYIAKRRISDITSILSAARADRNSKMRG
jgi:hypothetical protein